MLTIQPMRALVLSSRYKHLLAIIKHWIVSGEQMIAVVNRRFRSLRTVGDVSEFSRNVSMSVRSCQAAVNGSMSPTTQLSVDLVRGEGFRSKIFADPPADLIVLGVIGVPQCIEKLCKSLRSPTVLGRTISISRHTKLTERLVSEQNLFKKKVVLPSVTKIVLVQELHSRSTD